MKNTREISLLLVLIISAQSFIHSEEKDRHTQNMQELEKAVAAQALAAGVNPDRIHPVTEIPYLIHSAKEGNEDMVRLLLQYGANVNIQDEEGYTALHFACIYMHPKVIKALLEHGADVTIKSSSFYPITALEFLLTTKESTLRLTDPKKAARNEECIHEFTAFHEQQASNKQ